MNTEQATAAAITMLSEYFRQPLTDAAAQAYIIGLEDLTPEEIETSTKRAIRECKFMPSAAELLAFAGKGGPKEIEAAGVHAWEAVRQAMDDYDYTTSVDFGPLINAVCHNLGGWQFLCDATTRALVFIRKDFERVYAMMADARPGSLHGDPLRGAFAGPAVRIAVAGQERRGQIEAPRAAGQIAGRS